jgi:dipeptidyl-peptidase-4
VFTVAGRLFTADLTGPGGVTELPTAGPVVDPRLDPAGRLAAYVTGGALHVVPVDQPGDGSRLAADDDPDVTWGLADFIAAEEMDRGRGYWWAPDGTRIAVARVDNRPVGRWHVADPADPAQEPSVLRYPAAGTTNADVTLELVTLDGTRTTVAWDRAAFPYLARVSWADGHPLTLAVQSRDQRTVRVLTADPDTGATRERWTDTDEIWVELVEGSPAWLPDGRLVTAADRDDARRLLLDGIPVTPDGFQVRRVVATGTDGVVVTGGPEPTEIHLWRVTADGDPEPLTDLATPAVNDGTARAGLLAVTSMPLDGAPSTWIERPDGARVGIEWRAETPPVRPAPVLLRTGERALRTALLLPSDPALRDEPLPVLLDPYGGPHAQRVLASGAAFWASQWFADQGFAVVVTDGRGTPGRGPEWERAVHGDLAGPPLEDQVDALHALAADRPELDLGRVAIRGWSFGGYLAALAVLRRPDVFAAAIAGAPVTDWRLYDTHYTERYLGHPDEHPEAYERSSLLPDAARLERPLLLIHGLADDNVVAAHTLRLSTMLLGAGRPHTVLPLSGVTHMTPQEVVAENLLHLQLAFLRDAL